MAELDTSPTEESGATPIDEAGHVEQKRQARSFLAQARRNLSEDELSAPAVRRFLIEECERLDAKCAELDSYVERYHDLRVEKVSLESRLKSSRSHDVLSGLCLAAGSAGIGGSSRFLTVPGAESTGWVLLIVSAVLLVGGVASKVWK
jgi:hypothetical protein